MGADLFMTFPQGPPADNTEGVKPTEISEAARVLADQIREDMSDEANVAADKILAEMQEEAELAFLREQLKIRQILLDQQGPTYRPGYAYRDENGLPWNGISL